MSAGSSVQRMLFQNDWDDFVALCYFEGDGDWLDRCIQRAYLDMSRTLHGMAAFGRSHPGWRTSMKRLLKPKLHVLTASAEWTQQGFDSWHEACVASLQGLSDSLGYIDDERPSRGRFTVGQAQKWINMSIKYAVALGERRLPGFSGVYDVAHIPLDSIVLNELVTGLAGKKMDPLPHTWSRIPDYAEYFSCQLWVRENVPGIPLEIEFRLWEVGVRKNELSKEHGND